MNENSGYCKRCEELADELDRLKAALASAELFVNGWKEQAEKAGDELKSILDCDRKNEMEAIARAEKAEAARDALKGALQIAAGLLSATPQFTKWHPTDVYDYLVDTAIDAAKEKP